MATLEEDVAQANQRLQAQMRELADVNENLRHKLAQQEESMQALQDEVQRLQSLAALSADWYWEQDAEHRFKSFSKGSGQIWPANPDSSIGRFRWDRPGVVPLTSPWQAHRALLDSKQSFREFEYMQVAEDGSLQYFSVSGVPVIDGLGRFQGYRGTTRDISARKQLEESERRSTRLLGDIVENIPIAFYLASVKDDYRFVEWNKKAESLFGLTRAETIGRTVHDLWPRETADRMHAADLELVTGGSSQDFPDHLMQTAGRGQIRVHMRKVPLKDADGSVSHILLTIEDNTERLEAESRLRLSEARFRTVVAALGEGVVLRDAEGRVVDCNPSAERILGKTLAEMRGQTSVVGNWQLLREDGSLMPVEEQPNVAARLTGLRQSNRLVLYRKPDGSDLWCLVNVQPLSDGATGETTGFVTSVTDFTQRKLAELEIVRLNVNLENRVSRRTAQLEAANRELEAFSYSVAHDLRSPLSTIDGFCALLQKDVPAESGVRAQHYMERIRGGVRRMGELTNGLLALAQLSRTSLNWETVDVSEGAHKLLKEHFETDPLRVVRVTIAPALLVRGDRSLLGQVLQNLIANAWKFTSKKPHAEISIGKLADSRKQAVYFVKDNGAGFDMAYADKLFGTFQRLHSPEEFPGSGIGLATVYRIIARHGGKIWAESVPGEGSTFFFTLGNEQDHAAQDDDRRMDALEVAPRPVRSTHLFGKSVVSPDHGNKAISSDNDAYTGTDQQFSNAFEHAPIGMALIGLDSQRLRVNSAFCRMLGYSEAEMLSQTAGDITYPADIEWELLQRKRALAGEIETYQWEKRYVHRSGHIVWAYLSCSLVRDGDRRPLHFIAQVQDMTARKQIEETLRKSEERFRALTELSSDWYWEQDENFRFVEISVDVAHTALALASREDTIGKTRWDIYPVNSDENFWTDHKAQLERHEPFHELEIPILNPSGTVGFSCISGVPIFDLSGRFTGYRGIGRDTTEMRRLTDALRSSELQLRQITNALPALIAYVDAGQRFRFHNKAYEDTLGMSHEQIDGKSMLAVLGPKYYESVRSKIEQALTGSPVLCEITREAADGRPRDYALNYLPRYGEGENAGQVIGFYVLATDITELKRTDRLKSEFVSIVNGEFLPPLILIQDSLRAMRNSVEGLGLPLPAEEMMDAAHANCERLLCSIRDILDVRNRSQAN
jgi:PAS domain S-box-containing protein